MSDDRFNLIFRGEISPGALLPEVKRKLSHLLKLDEEKTALLFDGRTVVIKKDLSNADAGRYQAAFNATGGISVIELVRAAETLPVQHQPKVPLAASPADSPPRSTSSDQQRCPVEHPMGRQLATLTCPKCGTEQARSSSCIRCGIIFAKIHEAEGENNQVTRIIPRDDQPLTVAPNADATSLPGSRKHGIAAWVILLIGCGCLGYAPVDLAKTAIFVNSSREATGKVVGFSSSDRRKGSTVAPVVEFREPGGRLIRFHSKVGSSFSLYHVGEPVEVRFDPADPHRAELDTFVRIWGLGTFLLIFGASFTVCGVRLVRAQHRAKEVPPPRYTEGQLAGSLMYCTECGTQQPDSDTCGYCGAKISQRQREKCKRWMSFFEAFAGVGSGGNANGNVARIGKAYRFGIPLVAFALFFWNVYHGSSPETMPTEWRDSRHNIALTLPTDWQWQSPKDVANFPMLLSLRGDQYDFIASSKTAENTQVALGRPGFDLTQFNTLGWNGIVADIGRTNRVTFSDTVQFNSLSVYRVGYEVRDGYREDAFFEAAGDLLEICFVLPKGADTDHQAQRIRTLVMSNLTGT